MLWWMQHRDRGALKFKGFRSTTCETVMPHLWRVHLIRTTGESGFEPDRSAIRHGTNSGYSAVHIAASAGAKRILLLGFDMQRGKSGGLHWHQGHSFNNNTPDFERMITNFGTLVAPFKQLGIEVINCTADSALKCFPMARLNDCL